MAKTTQWTNLEVARLLRKIAAAYTILGENRFKIIAYDNAATAVDHATSEIKDLFDSRELDTVSGLGPAIRSHLEELFKAGRSRHFDTILTKINPAVFPLLDVPGLGPKKAEKLVKALRLKNPQTIIADLEVAAQKHKIANLDTFGAKSEEDILENLKRFRQGQVKEKRMLLPQADLIASEITSYLKKNCKNIVRIDPLGSLRRMVVTVGDLDMSVATEDFEEAIDCFVSYPKKLKIIERGPTGATILMTSGRQVDLRASKPDEYGAMLQYFTGSKYHNIRLRDFGLNKGLSLNEYGIKNLKNGRVRKFASEEEFYHFLGLDYIPPELREDRGEIQAALTHGLPKLVDLSDIKGDLHLHSNYDLEPSHDLGQNSMDEVINEAQSLNYEYIAFSEHNPKGELSDANIIAILKRRKTNIEQLKSRTKSIHLVTLLEVDIQPDGNLALPDEAFTLLDGALASVHSSFSMDKKKMTLRVLKALSHPAVKILAHPTGRLLEQRDEYELNWEEIFKLCLRLDKALEINGHPNRLDLSDTHVREAVKAGVKLVIDTDSHNTEDMTNMKYGVAVARRGWAEEKNVINTWPYHQLQRWLNKR